MPEYQSYKDWLKSLIQENAETLIQETQMTETTQENPAVSKLREAFDTARNAIIEGSELAKLVQELRSNVQSLSSEVTNLQRDLEYIRNRNRELDEQVTEVRRQRDNALMDAALQKDRADKAESDLDQARGMVSRINTELESALSQVDAEQHRADEAQLAQMALEDQLKTAMAKLAVIEGVFGKSPEVEKPKPHWEEQPRAETGEFQSFDRGSQSGSSGF